MSPLRRLRTRPLRIALRRSRICASRFASSSETATRRAKRAEKESGLDLSSVVSGLDGEAAVAVSSDDLGVAEAGDLAETTAWSTIKVPIALQVIEDAGGPDGLSSSQASLIERAITASDNEAAAELFAGIAAEHGGDTAAAQAVTEIMRRAGDDQPDVSTQGRDGFSSYGQTQWPVEAQVPVHGCACRWPLGIA